MFKKPNWDKWNGEDLLPLWMAVALALEMDPEDPQVAQARDGQLPIAPFEQSDLDLAQKYQKYLEDAACHMIDEPNPLFRLVIVEMFSGTALRYGWPLSEHFAPPYGKLTSKHRFSEPEAGLSRVVAASVGITLDFLGESETFLPHFAKRFRLPNKFSERYQIAKHNLRIESQTLPTRDIFPDDPTVRFSDFAKFARFKNWELPDEFPLPVAEPLPAGKWPWGNYETDLLRHLDAAAQAFWKAYEPGYPATAPLNDEIAEFLQKRGVAKRNSEVMATILRSHDVPPGPHVNRK